MIGLGKWKLNVSVPFLKSDPILIITDKNGQYEFTIDAQGFGITPAINLVNVKEENANTLRITAQIPMLNLGNLEGALTFEGMFCTGEITIPMLGRVSIKGERVG